MEKTNLAEIIKDARERLNISQRELSRRTGIDNNTISQIEMGNRKKPNSLYLIKLSQVLNIPLFTLMLSSGYTEEEVEMTYSANPDADPNFITVHTDASVIKHLEEQITKVEESIKKIQESKRTHSDPAYKNMSKEDIKFFDKQSDELIKVNKELLKVYKQRLDELKRNKN